MTIFLPCTNQESDFAYFMTVRKTIVSRSKIRGSEGRNQSDYCEVGAEEENYGCSGKKKRSPGLYEQNYRGIGKKDKKEENGPSPPLRLPPRGALSLYKCTVHSGVSMRHAEPGRNPHNADKCVALVASG